MMNSLKGLKISLKRWGVLIAMLAVQIMTFGIQLLYKKVLDEGTFVFALITYRHVVAVVCIAPFAIIWERDSLKKLTWWIFFWLFLCALTGITMAMGFFYYGLTDTTATYGSNFLNLIPIVTYIFTLLFRMEKLQLNTKAGRVKLAGVVLCLGGALTITLYKGKVFYISHHKHTHVVDVVQTNMVRGSIFLACSILSFGCWYLAQAKLFKRFPFKYASTLIICIIATVQSAVVGVCIDRKKESWKLAFNMQLLTIFCSGAFTSAATFCLTSWAVAKKGPAYPSMFNPLSLILVAFTEAVFFGQEISVGSLIGMFFIIVGLYLFLRANTRKLPFLEPNINEVLLSENARPQTRAAQVPTPIQPQII